MLELIKYVYVVITGEVNRGISMEIRHENTLTFFQLHHFHVIHISMNTHMERNRCQNPTLKAVIKSHQPCKMLLCNKLMNK